MCVLLHVDCLCLLVVSLCLLIVGLGCLAFFCSSYVACGMFVLFVVSAVCCV